MIRVYKYGMKPPIDFGDDCLQELQRMNAFWNKLVELDRQRETAFRQLCVSNSPEYAAAVERLDALKPQIDELYKDIRAERVKRRSKEPSPELKARKDTLLSERSQLWAVCKGIQKTMPKSSIAPLTEKFKAEAKLARQKSGCFWGNYNAVVESFDTAKSKAIKEGARLHFKQFDGSGRFVNQIQGGMTAAKLQSGTHSQAKLLQLEGKKPRGQFTWTAFTGRDSNGKRFRRELTATLTYHRPIPEDGVIKSIEVIREPHEGKGGFKWHACFIVQLPDENIEHPKRNITGVNLGWRQFGSRLRIAVAVDDIGHKTEYFLPAKLVNKFTEAEKLQQQADYQENTMLSTLREYYHRCCATAPQDWKEAVQKVLRNKPSRKTIDELTRCWAGSLDAFEDQEIYLIWRAWTKADKRARMSYTGCRRNAVKWREEIYRHIAKELAEHYAVIAVTDTPLAKMNRTKGNDGLSIDNELPEAARRNRVIAGIYTLKEWIEKQAVKTGSIVEKITDKVTSTCHHCGHIDEKRTPSAQHFTCTNCRQELEVDINAAINCRKLASGEVPQKKAARKATKYQRVREALALKNDSARESGDNASAGTA